MGGDASLFHGTPQPPGHKRARPPWSASPFRQPREVPVTTKQSATHPADGAEVVSPRDP